MTDIEALCASLNIGVCWLRPHDPPRPNAMVADVKDAERLMSEAATAIRELAARGFKNPKKTLAILKKAGVRERKPRVVPTLAAFTKMSLTERTKAFLKWVKTQKGGYRYFDLDGCALASFGKAMSDKVNNASGHALFLNDGYEITISDSMAYAIADDPLTYEALAQRLKESLS